LVNQNEPFENLENKKLTINEMLDSDDDGYYAIGRYFEKYKNNNVRTDVAVSFDFDNLI